MDGSCGSSPLSILTSRSIPLPDSPLKPFPPATSDYAEISTTISGHASTQKKPYTLRNNDDAAHFT